MEKESTIPLNLFLIEGPLDLNNKTLIKFSQYLNSQTEH